MITAAADRHLLFGLLALQNGIINQGQLVAAFQAWTLDKSKSLADHLEARGDLDGPRRALLEALAAVHVEAHGGDVQKSMAAVSAGRSTQESLSRIGGSEVEATFARIGVRPDRGTERNFADAKRTSTYSVGTATSDGQRFRVLRPHAKGGLGAVYVALDSELNREVALKQILDHHADDTVSRQRFLIEAEITGGLEHPGIVPVYGLGTYGDGRPYYAMRFIRGDSLKEAIEAFHQPATAADPGARSLELRTLLRRFTDVCNAVEYAHSRGVLHRDLKPGNVIVGKHGETLVVDWGLAKAMGKADTTAQDGEHVLLPSSASGSVETLPGSAMGTPAYMSPEQASGELDRLGPRSDVYSLGATLYCLLTGKAPFDGDVFDVIRKVQKGDFPRPREVETSIDPALEAVCLKSMATLPEDRYASCRALAQDIDRWAGDEPVTAYAEPFTRRARRWAKRHQTAVTAATVALLAGVVGLSAVAAVQSKSNAALTKANAAVRQSLAETQAAQKATATGLAQSDESRKQAESVGTFLVDAFKKPDPSTDGKDVKVADILDQAFDGLARGFSGSKATEGSLLDALGKSYYGLGLFRKAEEAYRKARAVREAALGPSHRDSLSSAFHQAKTVWYCGRQAEGMAILEEILKRQTSALGFDDPDTLETRVDLYWKYASSRRAAEAIPLLEAALAACESRLGPEHFVTFSARGSLAEAFRLEGRVAKAIATHEATLKLRESKLGLDHPATLVSRNNLALAYEAAGRTTEAIAMHEATLKLSESKLGPGHPSTLLSRSNLAYNYTVAGRTAEAIAMHEATLRLRESKLGPDHPDTLTSRNNLASAYQAAGRIAEAIAMHEATLKLRESKLGPDQPDTLTSRHNLADAYLAAGRAAEALAMHLVTLKLRESKLGPDHADTLISRDGTGRAYQIAGRTADAIAMHEATLKLYESKFGLDHHSTLNSRHDLAHAYQAGGRNAEAISLHETVLKASESKLGPDHTNTLRYLSCLGNAYQAAGRTAEAITIQKAGLKLMESKFGPDHRDTLGSRNSLALSYELLHRWADAEALYRDNVARRRKLVKQDSPILAGDLASLGSNLLKQSKWGEAEPLLRECLAIRVKSIPDDYRRFNAANLLGGALLGQKKYAEAEPLIVSGYDGLKARAAKIAAQSKFVSSEAEERVVELYKAWGKPDQAGAWAAKLFLADLPADVFAR